MLVLPGSTCLQESSAGSAQEHNGVVIDTGHRHRGQATVGEHGGRCDGVHDGQRVLKVRCSTVQLLRLQLWRDTLINGLQQTPAGPPPPSPPQAQRGQTADGPAAPRGSSSLPSHGIGKCNWLIREQRAVIELPFCLPDLPSEPNPDQALLEMSCQRRSALAHAMSRIRAAPGLLLEPSRCRAPQEGILQPKAHLL